MTSRELLRIRGEVDYPVPPLAGSEAVELFCTRSRLEPSEEIAELCARLDDLPLAVELAAARTSVLSPRQILERLSQRLDLLRGGRDAEARQRTLRATIEWSYDLLTEEEKRLFAALSVFAGGCTLEAAESVCDADLDALQSLVDKSLLRHTDERFWMLETIREFALERLEDSGGAEDLRRRYSRVLSRARRAREAGATGLELVGLVRPVRSGARQHPGRARRRARARPLRRRITARRRDLRVLVRAGLLERGPPLARAGSGRHGDDPRLRADALPGAGLLAVWQGDVERGRAVSEELLTIAAEIGSPRARFDGLLIAGIATDDPDEDVRCTQRRRDSPASWATRRWWPTA